jgi:hypothetical protein
MTKEIRTERRWLRSVIAASAEPLPSFPWMRGQRKRPAAMTAESVAPVDQTVTHHKITLFSRKGALAAR